MVTEQDVRNAVIFATGHPAPFVEVVQDDATHVSVWVLAAELAGRHTALVPVLDGLRPQGMVLTLRVLDDGGFLDKLAAL